jgi:hypothetical protein
MEQIVRVKKVHEDGTVRAVLVRQSACSGDCHKCSGCGAATQTMELITYRRVDRMSRMRESALITRRSSKNVAHCRKKS